MSEEVDQTGETLRADLAGVLVEIEWQQIRDRQAQPVPKPSVAQLSGQELPDT